MRRSDQPPHFTPAPLPIAELSDGERLACLRLIRSENVGPATFRELINQFGGAQRALDALPALSSRGGSRRPIRVCSKADAEKELEAAARAEAEPVFTVEPNYPALLARVEAPPPILYLKGRRELLNRPAVAIVGSRQCSAAGVQITRRFASELGQAGFVVISGLARGIDKAAHDASLDRGTIAVLAGDIDWVYPPEHGDLQRSIAEAGCLVTERPPGFQPRDKDFPRRNRIIAGLAYGVVIVEAASRSGSLVTARFANDLGREVFAVPGHPLDPRAEGTNRLIKQGAALVTSSSDIIEVLQPIVGSAGAAEIDAREHVVSPPAQSTRQQSNSDNETAAVVAALGPAPVAIDEIVRATGLSVQSVHIALLGLDLAGRIERQGFGLVALKAG